MPPKAKQKEQIPKTTDYAVIRWHCNFWDPENTYSSKYKRLRFAANGISTIAIIIATRMSNIESSELSKIMTIFIRSSDEKRNHIFFIII